MADFPSAGQGRCLGHDPVLVLGGQGRVRAPAQLGQPLRMAVRRYACGSLGVKGCPPGKRKVAGWAFPLALWHGVTLAVCSCGESPSSWSRRFPHSDRYGPRVTIGRRAMVHVERARCGSVVGSQVLQWGEEDVQAILIAIITTIVGVTVAISAARHYYTRSVKHRLAVYWLPAPSILSGVDRDTRKELSIQFRGELIKELAVTEFLIANEGADPIRESIEPLTFKILNDSEIVDASTTYVQPEGRKVAVGLVSDKEFRCDFPLLNPNEYFYVKLITDGALPKSKLACEITAENLPPRIPIENPTRVTIDPGENKPNWVELIPAAIFLLLGASVFLPIVGLYQAQHRFFPLSGAKYQFIWWLTPALVIAALVAVAFLLIGLMFGFSARHENWSFPPNKHFKGPRRPYHPHVYGYGYYPIEPENPLTRYPRE
jgi:hypothetical protein